jgi:predicted nucleic acid-binding protein
MKMSVTEVYLDTNVIVGLFTVDPLSALAEAILSADPVVVFVSDLALAECASVLARRVRMAELTREEAKQAFIRQDEWMQNFANITTIQPSDIADAARFIRRLDLNLRLQDAIHIATAMRTGTLLATFDVKMAESAVKLGCPILEIKQN